MGIRKPSNFIAVPQPTHAITHRPKIEVLPPEQHSFAVTPSATQHVEVKTNSVDRAKGFLIASIPRTFAFSLTVSILSIVLGGVSLGLAFVVLFSVFSLTELVSYIVTLLLSAEGVSWYEARRKWNVIEREQTERWRHYQNNAKR
jgi:hypothetical protein